MINKSEILERIHGGLIVSCQALEEEPLYGASIMARMAYAACLGGAVGIRANTPEDIKAIKKEVKVPVIGLYKQTYPDSEVYITPVEEAVDSLMESGADIIAMDATRRIRPFGVKLDTFFYKIRSKYPDMLFMADCADFEDAVFAQELGFDLAGTTLCGYTRETKGITLPNIRLMKELASALKIPVIAEGGIWTPEQLAEAMEAGAYAAVVGTAITRPMEITRRFVDAINRE